MTADEVDARGGMNFLSATGFGRIAWNGFGAAGGAGRLPRLGLKGACCTCDRLEAGGMLESGAGGIKADLATGCEKLNRGGLA